MSWVCDKCSRGDGESTVDAVCHHCGALLCRDCRHEIPADDLVGTPADVLRTAIHCSACRRRHHPFSVSTFRIFAR